MDIEQVEFLPIFGLVHKSTESYLPLASEHDHDTRRVQDTKRHPYSRHKATSVLDDGPVDGHCSIPTSSSIPSWIHLGHFGNDDFDSLAAIRWHGHNTFYRPTSCNATNDIHSWYVLVICMRRNTFLYTDECILASNIVAFGRLLWVTWCVGGGC